MEITHINILQISTGVFFGAVTFAWLMWTFKQLNRPDPEDDKLIIRAQLILILLFHLGVFVATMA